jgi:hypothetical protein
MSFDLAMVTSPKIRFSEILEIWAKHPEWGHIERFASLIDFLQDGESNSQFAKDLGVVHTTIKRWKDGTIGQLSDDIFYSIAPLTPYSPGELMELLRDFDKPAQKFRKLRTAEEVIELANKLPGGERVEICKKILEQLPKHERIFLVQKMIENLAGLG